MILGSWRPWVKTQFVWQRYWLVANFQRRMWSSNKTFFFREALCQASTGPLNSKQPWICLLFITNKHYITVRCFGSSLGLWTFNCLFLAVITKTFLWLFVFIHISLQWLQISTTASSWLPSVANYQVLDPLVLSNLQAWKEVEVGTVAQSSQLAPGNGWLEDDPFIQKKAPPGYFEWGSKS